jgi:hypothetical protein
LTEVIPVLRRSLESEVVAIDRACQEAKVEENDYTVLTVDDLAYELELTEAGIRKKIAFVENQVSARNHTPLVLLPGRCLEPFLGVYAAWLVEPELTPCQMVSATHTNLTPAKLEEFEATFKHFDKDDTNVRTRAHRLVCLPAGRSRLMAWLRQTLMLWEMNSALASLGIVYAVSQSHCLLAPLRHPMAVECLNHGRRKSSLRSTPNWRVDTARSRTRPGFHFW